MPLCLLGIATCMPRGVWISLMSFTAIQVPSVSETNARRFGGPVKGMLMRISLISTMRSPSEVR